MSGPIIETGPAHVNTPSDGGSHITFTGAEMRGGLDGFGFVPACVLDLLEPLAAKGSRVLIAGPYADELVTRLVDAGYQVDAQLRGVMDAERAAEELPASVRVRCGSLRGVSDSYDAVIALGGLGYLETGDAPLDGWADAMTMLAGLVAPGGVLAVTVRNGFGIDHLTGSDPGVHGHHRDAFGANHAHVEHRLAEAGLSAEAEFAIYPDTAAPAVLVHHDAYSLGGETLTTLVASAYRSTVAEAGTVTDPRRTARASIGYGLGPALAPGWLIMARRAPGGEPTVAIPGTVMVTDVRYDDFRSAPYIASQAVDGSWTRSRPASTIDGAEHHSGIHRNPALLDGLIPAGDLLEERLLEASATHDVLALRELLTRYSAWLGVSAKEEGETAECPPARTFAMLDNIVIDGSMILAQLDPTWQLEDPIAAEVVFVAALCRFADRLLAGALPHPWVSAQSPERLAARLASMAGLVVTPPLLAAAASHAAHAVDALDGHDLRELDEPSEPPLGDHERSVVVGPVAPIGPVARPRGLAEAVRTIDTISIELAGTHEQLAFLTEVIADRDMRLARAVREAARVQKSQVYRTALSISIALKTMRKTMRKIARRLLGR